tara:strand:- start:8946 stop:10178 length:1233 start_codon:yes stop_codon:yes gene_type:complete
MEVNGLPVVKLGEVLPKSYKNGIYKAADAYGQGTYILRITDFDNEGTLFREKLQKLKLTQDEIDSFKLNTNDIIVNRVNSLSHIGKTILWDKNIGEEVVYESNMMRIEADENLVLPNYLIRVFQTYNARTHFRKVAKRAVAQCSINQQDIKSLTFPLPPLPEQKKIAQILSTWDKAITTTEQLLANSQQQKKALMKQLLTGKKRLPGFSGEWIKGELGDIAKIDTGFAFKSSDFTNLPTGIPVIRMSDFKNGSLDISSAAKVSDEAISGLDRFKLNRNDFVFGMSGSLTNYGWVTEKNLPCYLNQRVGRIVAKEGISQLFTTYLYLSEKIQKSILDKAAGAAQLNISVNDLRSTKINYPRFEEQQKIAAILSGADQEISNIRQRLDCMKLEKSALMQQLLTGKKRVSINS